MTGHVRDTRDFILNGFVLNRTLQRAAQYEAPDGLDALGLTISSDDIIDPYIDKISEDSVVKAVKLGDYYKVIYVVENLLRNLIVSLLDDESDEYGDLEEPTWWKKNVPDHVQRYAKDAAKRETDVAVTQRAVNPIEYVTFGHLSDVIVKNWDVFQLAFTSPKAVARVLGLLNTIRGPIAHCNDLKDDEIARLFLAVRDFFRILK